MTAKATSTGLNLRLSVDLNRSAATASATPSVASANAYGKVALVSAYVEVCGTAAGMLPTA